MWKDSRREEGEPSRKKIKNEPVDLEIGIISDFWESKIGRVVGSRHQKAEEVEGKVIEPQLQEKKWKMASLVHLALLDTPYHLLLWKHDP